MTRAALLVLLGMIPGSLFAQNAEDYLAALTAGRAALAQSDYPTAISLLEPLTAVTPEHADLWLSLAGAYAQTGRDARALDAARRAIELGASTPPWFVAYRIAAGFAQAGQRDSALGWLERALELGWGDRPGIRTARSFAAFRDDPAFVRISGALPVGPLTRSGGWQFDIALLEDEVRRLHTAPDLPDLPDAFERQLASVRARLAELTDEEIYLELRRLIVALGDGHSWITSSGTSAAAGSGITFDQSRLPVRFYLFSDGLYVVRTAAGYEHLIGARVTRVGDLVTEEAITRIADFIARDNPQGIKAAAPGMLRVPTFLRGIGAMNGNTIPYTVEMTDGTRRTVELTAGSYDLPSRLPARASDRPAPLHLRPADGPYWLEALPEHDAVYFHFSSVRNAPSGPSIPAFADELRRALERTGARNLIIDVRHNGGGNNTLLRPFLRTLTWWDVASDDHTIYLITGRGTFSAAQNFVNRVEQLTDAIIVGEAAASRPNFVGESSTVRLPYSGLRASISNRYWQDSHSGDMRRWILPDLPVTTSSGDYFGNRDPVLDAIRRVIDAGRRESGT